MREAVVVIVAALAVLTSAAPATAQQTDRIYRIGFLTPGSPSARMVVFKHALGKLGYEEGKNIAIEARYAKGRQERLPVLAAELAALKVDVFVTHGEATRAAQAAAKAAGRAIPIVFAVAADPIGRGFVASLSKPGGNITGLSDTHSILVPKRLELLKEVVPSIRRVAVFWSPDSGFTGAQLKKLEAVAPRLGIVLVPLKFGRHEDVESAFAALRRVRPDALNVLGYPFSGIYRKRISEFALAHRLPTVFTARRSAVAGGLMSYGVDFHDQYRRAAVFVDKILKGAKPADLPVEQPTRFYLRINLKTARALGIEIPRAVLLRANELIE